MIEGYDATVAIHPDKIKAANKKFVIRYVSTPGNTKNITAEEVKLLQLHKIPIVIVFETTANRALNGATAGGNDAISASQQTAAIGLQSCPIYFAVDFNPQRSEYGAILDYFTEACNAIGKKRVGAYGGGDILKYIRSQRVAKYFWQSASTSFGPPLLGRNLQQLGQQIIDGHTVDTDEAYTKDFGQSPRPSKLIVVPDNTVKALIRAYRKLVAWVTRKSNKK